MTRGGAMVRLLGGATGLAALLGLAANFAPEASGASGDSPAVPPLALAGTLTTPAMAAVDVLMGRNDGNFDLFWQLFTEQGTGPWKLVTPPGVADNGGLITAASTGGTLLVGFGASQGLDFSPLALSADAGGTWSPGGLDKPLVVAPGALAAGRGGEPAVALVQGAGSEVLARAGGLTSWRRLVTSAELASDKGTASCGIVALTAVGVSAGGDVVVGSSCRHPGVVGIFEDDGGDWRGGSLELPVALTRDDVSVLRLPSPATGAPGILLAEGPRGGTVLAAFTSATANTLRPSAPLPIPRGGQVLASGSGPGGEAFVVMQTSRGQVADTLRGPGADWAELPTLPPNAVTLAFSPGGPIEAIAVNDTVFTAWRLEKSRTWKLSQTIKVPIVFGSSS